MLNRLVGTLGEHKSILHSHEHTHIFICAFENDALCEHILYSARPI